MNQLPAYLQNPNRVSRDLAKTLAGNLGAGSPPYLSIMGNRLSLIDAVGNEQAVPTYNPQTGPYLDCVVIDALEHTSKIYYDKPFDPGAQQYEPPACFSDNGIAPSRNATKPQSPTCAACQWNAWGSKVSAVSGKGVKACQDIQKIALLVSGYEMPFLLRIPPNSRTNFRNFVHKFVGQPMDLADVLTRICFEPGTIGTLKFEAIGWLDDPTVAQRDKLVAVKATDAMVGRTDQPRQEALPAPAQAHPEIIPAQPAMPAQTAPVSQPAPFMPAQPVAQPSSTASGAQPAATAQTAAPSPQTEPQRRRRRTNAEITAANAPQGQAPAQTQAAPFMPGPVTMPPPNAQAPAPAQGGQPFGIAPGAAPNADLAQTLNSLFGGQKT